MAETMRSLTELQTLLADNTSRDISPQDIRDLMKTVFGHFASATPGVNNDANDTAGIGVKFSKGSQWINTSGGVIWFCIDDTPGAAVWNYVVTDPSNVFPKGTILDYAGSGAPSGWLLCDGTAVSRTTYSGLFTVIGVTWGAGDGSTTFNVPDLKGRVTIGVGTGTGLTARALADSGGAETHVLSVGELAQHAHSIPTAVAPAGAVTAVGKAVNLTAAANANTNNIGSNNPHNNMQPFKATTKIIKY